MPKRAAKRKPEEVEDGILARKKLKPDLVEVAPLSDDLPVEESLSYKWIDAGNLVQGSVTDHKLLETTVDGVRSIIAVGDCILLRSSEYDDIQEKGGSHSKEGLAQQVAFVARVERMWEEPGRKKPREDRMKIRARWFFKKKDLESLGGAMIGPISRIQLIGTMTNRDIILSDQEDDNDVLTILGKCTVLMRCPSKNDSITTLPLNTFVCRYSISFGETPGSAVLSPFDGENDLWPSDEAAISVPAVNLECLIKNVDEEAENESKTNEGISFDALNTRSKRCGGNSLLPHHSGNESLGGTKRMTSVDTALSSDNDSVSDDTTSSSYGSDDQFDGKGNTKGRILVGPEHQVNVLSFKGTGEVMTRNPVRVWKPNSIDQKDIDAYLTRSGDILALYLKQNSLLMEDPYLPLPSEHVDSLTKEHSKADAFLTLSDISTASSMSQQRNKLTRECKTDKLFMTLHLNNYNVDNALNVVATTPRDFVTVWSKKDKALLDSGFRRFSGSLRMISKGVAISKSFKDVVDYHYRFKIPDQFRRYQDKKRENAVRMMNILEGRRSLEAPVQSRSDEMVVAGKVPREKKTHDWKKPQEWAKTAISDVIGAVEERRIIAKDLLLQIQLELGNEKLIQIMEAVKLLHRSSVAELKERAVELLHDKPELLDRFLAFLPKRFRF